MSTALHNQEMLLVWPKANVELDLAPLQGLWSESMYLKLAEQTNRLIEFTDGTVEILPMPSRYHQAISALLFIALLNFITPRGGRVYYAPLRLQIRPGKQREPDILLLRDAHDPRNQNEAWLGADLVIEIVSPDDPQRDTVTKRGDYAEAGIPEYWIVNPIDETVTVLAIDGTAYREHGIFGRGETAKSHLLDGFEVSVDQIFDAQ
jgi:Uma2 family endonuclease